MADSRNELVNNKNAHHILGIVGNHDNMEVGKDVSTIVAKVCVCTINFKIKPILNSTTMYLCNDHKVMGLRYVKQVFNGVKNPNLHKFLQPMKVWSWRTLLLSPLRQKFRQSNNLQRKH